MNKDVMVIEDYVDHQCRRHLHLMANSANSFPSLSGRETVTREAGAWHLRTDYPYCGMLDLQVACRDGKFRRLVVWSLEGCGSVRDAIHSAFTFFWATFCFQPGYVFMRRLPGGTENGQDVDGMILLEANWMLEKCVAVGGRQ